VRPTEIITLGRTAVLHDGVELPSLSSQRRQLALLVFLAVEGPVSRGRLISTFWPDRDAEKARHSLAQALYALRQELGERSVIQEGDVLSVGPEISIDAAAMRNAIIAEDWQRVVEFYDGPFLAGFSLSGSPEFEEWAAGHRARYASDARRAFRQAIARYRSSGDTKAAAALASRWSDIEPSGAADEPEAEPEIPEAVPVGWNAVIDSLKTRHYFRILLLYLGAAWLAVQFFDILVDRNVLAPGFFPLVLYIVGLGFPVALLLAWLFERKAQRAQGATAPLRIKAAEIGYAIGAVALIALILVSVLDRLRPQDERDVFPATRIAVLYFDDHSDGDTLSYLAEALTEHLTHELAQISALDVLPRNAVKPYRETGTPSDVIAGELGVGTLVEGSVLGFADSVRISVQLIDARNMSHLTSAVIAGAGGDPFALLDDVGSEIARLLRTELGMEIQLREWRAGTESTAAWERVKRANAILADYEPLVMSGDTAAAGRTLDLADTLLARAEAADPNWPEPIVQRGWIAASRAALFSTPAEENQSHWFQVGIEHAERALAIDSENARALELRGILRSRIALEAESEGESNRLLTEAEDDLRRATDLNIGLARAWSRLSRIQADRGQFAEAKLAAQRAFEADAFLRDAPVVLARLCEMSLQLQDWNEVTRWCELGRQRFPDDEFFAAVELSALAGPVGPEPDVDLAWDLVEQTLRLSPPGDRDDYLPALHMQAAAVIARAGLADSAVAVIDGARAADPRDDPELDYQEANARLIMGDVDEALRLLAEFLEAEPEYAQFLESDWWFDRLHDDPRFLTLVDGPN
jgi:TolB-like protein